MKLLQTPVKVLGALALAFASFQPVAADELRFSTPTPPPHIFTKMANRIAESLSEPDGDQIKVFPVNPLGTDLEGLKSRAFPNDIFRAFWSELDAAPSALPLPEIMPSLVTGVIDAVDVDIDIVFGLKMHEQAPNLVLTNHMAFPGAVLASARWWSGLDADRQQEITDAVAEAQAWAIEEQTAGEVALLERLNEAGTNVTMLEDDALLAAGVTVREAFLSRDPLVAAFYEATVE